MKKLYTILLVTFVSINLFGQTGYKLDPGKINIWNNTILSSNNYTFPGAVYTGVENLVTLNYNSYFSYAKVIGIKNTVNSSYSSYTSPVGMESVATGSGYPIGVIGSATGNDGSTGLSGQAYSTIGVQSGSYRGVSGFANASGTSAKNYGVYGNAYSQGSSSSNYGVFGDAGNSFLSCSGCTNYGVYGTTYTTNNSFAGYFAGNVHVNGTLSKSSGTFKIDHPLDPLNKYLSHSFVESPDMMNIYNGNITTDQNGKATVNLPEYFEALNMDFRYQLTAIGDFAQVIVKEKIRGNQFVVATDKPNIEVSWQVTGVRNDAYAKKNRVVPEQDKPDAEKGKYLNADAFGLPREQSLHSVKSEEGIKKREEALQSAASKEEIKK